MRHYESHLSITKIKECVDHLFEEYREGLCTDADFLVQVGTMIQEELNQEQVRVQERLQKLNEVAERIDKIRKG